MFGCLDFATLTVHLEYLLEASYWATVFSKMVAGVCAYNIGINLMWDTELRKAQQLAENIELYNKLIKYKQNDFEYFVVHVYNPKEKLYYRSVNNKAHTDYITKKQYTAKNIIIIYVDNGDIGSDSKGRQELENIGTGTGFYVTNGACVPITWEKKSRTSQTIYRYKDGKEINVSDGNTYIQIAPKNSAKIK